MEEQELNPELLKRYLNGTSSEAENARIESWYADRLRQGQSPDEASVMNRHQQMREKLTTHITQQQNKPIRPLWPKIAAAASILIILSAGLYIYNNKAQTNNNQQLAQKDFKPGRQQATLTLANGQKIILTKGLSGQLATQNQTSITATSGKAIQYQSQQPETTVSYNTLSTAKGEQSPYPLILADGTKVWLNAASKITFPTAFPGKERIVKLTGEAYFEVAHNAKQPFKVETEKQTIEDLGTRFNVNAYSDEPHTITSLLEGAVKVNQLTLKPGQESNGSTIQNTDTSEAIAWKNGDFSFDGADVATVMRAFARWYNVDVTYQGQPKKVSITGHVHRNVNASQAMKILQLWGIRYKTQGNTITIIP